MCVPGAILAGSAQKQPEGLLAVKHSEGTAGECMGRLEETVSEEEGDGIQNKVYGGQQETREVEGNMARRIFLHPPSCTFQESGKHWGNEGLGAGLASPWVRKYESPGVQLW